MNSIHGILPFWFWNGPLDADEIRFQIRAMADQGIRGFFIHPRQGLEVPYLSTAYFDLVAVAVEAARAAGMRVFLYDEYPYPSGIAGGLVTLGNPAYRATRLVLLREQGQGPHIRLALPPGKLLSATAYPADARGEPIWTDGIDLSPSVGILLSTESCEHTGLTAYNRTRYFAHDPALVLDTQLGEGQFWVYAGVQCLVEDHKYWSDWVDVLNPEAVGEFIRLTHDRYAAHLQRDFGDLIPAIFTDETTPHWSPLIPPEFLRLHGYDLLQALPALQDERHPDHLTVTADLQAVRYRMFCGSFEEQIGGWCRKHGLAYTGEKPAMRLSQLRYMDIPGGDPGHTKAGAPSDVLQPQIRQNARALASAAYLYGKAGSLCECYHSLGWSGTLQDAKAIADMLLYCGVTTLVPHGFFATTHGLKKHDAPPSFFFQMPFWDQFHHVSEHVDAIVQHFEGTWIDARVLLVDPSVGLPTPEQRSVYTDLMWSCVRRHIDLLIVDTDVLEEAHVLDGVIHVRDIRARAIIVPPMRHREPALVRRLDELRQAGVPVVGPDDVVRDESDVQLTAERPEKIAMVARRGEGRRLWFVVNTAALPQTVRLATHLHLREVPLPSTPITRLQACSGGYARPLDPFESCLLDENPSPPPAPPPCHDEWVDVADDGEVRPLGANLLRLGAWSLRVCDENGQAPQTADVLPMPISNQLEQGGFSIRPRFLRRFGGQPVLEMPPLSLHYEAQFINEYSGAIRLVMEPGSIAGEWRILLNGSSLDRSRMEAVEDHVRGSLGTDVTPCLRQGTNTIEVTVQVTRMDQGLLCPLYLAGDFGVRLAPLALVAGPARGRFEAYRHNLLPYYSGAIEYARSFDAPDLPAHGEVLIHLRFPRVCREAMEVRINGGEPRPIPFHPHAVLVPARRLREHGNLLVVRVFTSLIRSFDGEYFDHATHRAVDVGQEPDLWGTAPLVDLPRGDS